MQKSKIECKEGQNYEELKCQCCNQKLSPKTLEHNFERIDCEGFGTVWKCKRCGYTENDD